MYVSNLRLEKIQFVLLFGCIRLVDYSNLPVSTMSKRMDTGLDSGPEPLVLLDQKAV